VFIDTNFLQLLCESLMTPTLLNNRYRVIQTLGSGGFGNTFLAEDTYMPSGRRCVIKQLKPVTHDPKAYETVKERFQREAAVLEELGEGNNQIPRLFAYFSEAGQFYLVQEYIEGDTLTKRVEQGGSFGEREVKEMLASLLPVLDYVHSRRMIHRDIKPDNIILRKRDGLPVLIDFGAVKEAMNTVVNAPAQVAPSMVIGTPGFMPAEQARGRPTYASDLYSLGLVAVFLLTGKMPQELQTDDRTGEMLWRQHAPNLHSELATVIDRAIRFTPGDRFASAKEMLDALQSSGSVSQMDTVAVAPGGLPQPPNRSTPPVANPYSPQTVPAGSSPAVQQNDRKPLVIAALVAGGLIVGGVAIAVGLTRSGEQTSTVSSSRVSEPTTEQTIPEQPSDPMPSRSRRSDSEPPLEQPPSRTPSRSEPADAEPTIEQPTQEQSPFQTPSPSRSRSEPADSEPNVVPSTSSRSQRETPTTSESPPQSFPSQPIPEPTPSPQARNNNSPPRQSSSIPAFAPGTQENYVKQDLGRPTKTSKGVWPNTRAVLYEDYVPGQVDLGYLFDRTSGRLRQTEASFAPSVELPTISSTLEQMLNNNASADIQQALESVYQRQSKRYKFTSGSNLKGVIQRDREDRIYIGVWEADLHN
jgi:serine/threonine protein kinase, bacterial